MRKKKKLYAFESIEARVLCCTGTGSGTDVMMCWKKKPSVVLGPHLKVVQAVG